MRRILLLAALLACGPALAQPAPDQPPPPPSGQPGPLPTNRHPHRFEEANITHDGKLTLDQAQANHWHPIVKNFGAIDRDHKGYITKQDLKEWRQERRAERAAAKAGQPPAAPAPPAPPGAPAAAAPPAPPAAPPPPDGAPHY